MFDSPCLFLLLLRPSIALFYPLPDILPTLNMMFVSPLSSLILVFLLLLCHLSPGQILVNVMQFTAACGHLPLLRWLLGWSAQAQSEEANMVTCARTLVRVGQWCERESKGRSPLHYAAAGRQVEVLDWLWTLLQALDEEEAKAVTEMRGEGGVALPHFACVGLDTLSTASPAPSYLTRESETAPLIWMEKKGFDLGVRDEV